MRFQKSKIGNMHFCVFQKNEQKILTFAFSEKIMKYDNSYFCVFQNQKRKIRSLVFAFSKKNNRK